MWSAFEEYQKEEEAEAAAEEAEHWRRPQTNNIKKQAPGRRPSGGLLVYGFLWGSFCEGFAAARPAMMPLPKAQWRL